MRPFCFIAETGTNFGDDLNRWLWPRLLPEAMSGPDDGVLFLGIGTVIGPGLPDATHYVVFSSGAGYGPPPKSFGGPSWTLVCVRGPLTARVLGLAPELASSDGALLLSTLPEYSPLPESERAGVVFMPHHENLDIGDWPEICRRAGVEFLSPLLPSEEVLARIRRARLVLADAMHAAIVADTLRVPWVPVAVSNRINTFKWLDWTMGLDLPYRPVLIPAPTRVEALRDRMRGLYGQRHLLDEQSEQAAIRDFKRNKALKEHPLWASYARFVRKFAYFAPGKVLRMPAFAASVAADTARRTEFCAAALRNAAGSTAHLSDDAKFSAKVSQLVEKLEDVRRLRFPPLG